MEVLSRVAAFKMETDLRARGKSWTHFPGIDCNLPLLSHILGRMAMGSTDRDKSWQGQRWGAPGPTDSVSLLLLQCLGEDQEDPVSTGICLSWLFPSPPEAGMASPLRCPSALLKSIVSSQMPPCTGISWAQRPLRTGSMVHRKEH